MTITAYDRASEILISLRECILKPVHNVNEKDACNKRMKEFYDELDEVCRKAHVRFFSYIHNHMGISLEPGLVTLIRTVEDRDSMHDEWGLYLEIHEYTIKHPFMDMENGLISQAAEWRRANKEALSSVTLPEQETTLGHDIQLPDNPTIEDITVCINKYVTGKPYSSKTIWEHISKMDDVEPIDKKGKASYYDKNKTCNVIVPRLLKLPRVVK